MDGATGYHTVVLLLLYADITKVKGPYKDIVFPLLLRRIISKDMDDATGHYMIYVYSATSYVQLME